VLAQTSITDSFECPGAARRPCGALWITSDASPPIGRAITSLGALRQTLDQGRRERRCSGPFRWKERPKLGPPVPYGLLENQPTATAESERCITHRRNTRRSWLPMAANSVSGFCKPFLHGSGKLMQLRSAAISRPLP
jgi:hypothetical protein